MRNTIALLAEILGFIATFAILGFWLAVLALN